MELTFTIDTDDLFGEDGWSFESLLTDSLMREVKNKSKGKLASHEFQKFADLASDAVVADIKLRMENFLSEEIVLTGDWGKKTFVGSIEDLIKHRFDDVLLRPVDSSGNTLKGCTSSSKTWIEWTIEKKLGRTLEDQLQRAANDLKHTIKKHVDKKIVEIKDAAIKSEVDATFTSILKKA